MTARREVTVSERLLGVSPGNALPLLVVAAAFGGVFLARNALGYLGPFIALDLDLPNEKIGLLAAAFSLTWAISGFVIPAITRSGSQSIWLAGLVLTLSLASAASGFAATIAALVLARLVGGVVSGPILPLTQSFVVPLGPDSCRGLRMGVVQGLGGGLIGAVLAPLVLVPIAVSHGWRNAYLFIAAAIVVCAGFLARVLPHKIAEKRECATDTLGKERGSTTAAAFSHTNILICCLISASMVGWLILTLTFFPLYLVRVANFTPSEMGAVMSVMGLGSVAAGFLVPFLSDQLGRRRTLIAFCLVGIFSPLAVLLVHSSVAALAVCVLVGSLAGGTFPVFMAVIPSLSVEPRRLAKSIGVVQGIGEVAGGVVAPLVGGWAADRFGLEVPLLMSMGLALFASTSGFAITDIRVRTIRN